MNARDEFMVVLGRETVGAKFSMAPSVVADLATTLIKLNRQWLKLQREKCSATLRSMDQINSDLRQVQARLELKLPAGVSSVFTHNPAVPVKLVFRGKQTNDWSRKGWCIPT